MNSKNVKAIKVQTKSNELLYEVVYNRKLNDLRDVNAYPDKRTVGSTIGDGWSDSTNMRDVLNEHVDDFIDQLDRSGIEYELLGEKDI